MLQWDIFDWLATYLVLIFIVDFYSSNLNSFNTLFVFDNSKEILFSLIESYFLTQWIDAYGSLLSTKDYYFIIFILYNLYVHLYVSIFIWNIFSQNEIFKVIERSSYILNIYILLTLSVWFLFFLVIIRKMIS